MTDKIGMTELNKILFNSMPRNWSKQTHAYGFDSESINFKRMLIYSNRGTLLNIFMKF